MRKIPTVFKRDPEDMRRVLPEVTEGCEWVLAGEGIPTRKYDGTCVMFDGERWWARREVKFGKQPPENFKAEGTDENTGKTVGWEPVEQSGFAKWHAEALLEKVVDYGEGLPPGTYELCGPKVNGNPEDYMTHELVSHADAETFPLDARTFEEVRAFVQWLGERGVEGIVWHHPDGRMAKIKARDFARAQVA